MKQSDTWVEGATAALFQAGFRRGGSRRKVLEVLAREDCLLTAIEIDERLPAVGRATVYRTLEQLEELGLVLRVDLGGNAAGYERIEPDGAHHHHLVCDECGQVVPFEDSKLERVIRGLARRSQFTISSHDVTLHGQCDRCEPASS